MKKIQVLAVKEDGQPFRVIQAKVCRESLDRLKPGKYRLTVEKYTKKASHSQFGYAYGYVYSSSLLALNDAGYEFTNLEQVNDFWMTMFATKEILNRETGEIMKLPLHKSEFTTSEMVAYIDQIRNYCSEYLGVFIDDPNTEWKNNQKLNTKTDA